MKLYYLLSLEVNTAAIVADNPPENISVAIGDELMSHLQDSSVRDALGVCGVSIEALDDEWADGVTRARLTLEGRGR